MVKSQQNFINNDKAQAIGCKSRTLRFTDGLRGDLGRYHNFIQMRNPDKKPKGQPHIEWMLYNQLEALIDDFPFTNESIGSLLALLEIGHANLHEADYKHMFKLMYFLNSVSMVQKARLVEEAKE